MQIVKNTTILYEPILFNISDKTLKNTDYAELRNDEIQK